MILKDVTFPKLLHYLLLAGSMLCATSFCWAARPLSLAELKRREQAEKKQQADRLKTETERFRRLKTATQVDLENHEARSTWLQDAHAAIKHLRIENAPLEEQIAMLRKIVDNVDNFDRASPQEMLDALAVNLALAYRAQPAVGLPEEFVALGYRDKARIPEATLATFADDTLALAMLVASKAPSPKKQRKLLNAFAAKFEMHAQQALPEARTPLSQMASNWHGIRNAIEKNNALKERERIEARRRAIQENAPKNISSWLELTGKLRDASSDPLVRAAKLSDQLPDHIDEIEAKIWLDALAAHAKSTLVRQQADDIFVLANVIALKTGFGPEKILRRARIQTAILSALLTPYWIAAGILGTRLMNDPGAPLSISVVGIALTLGIGLGNLINIDSPYVLAPVEPFSNSALERANQVQAAKMMAHFFSALGFKANTVAAQSFDSPAFCDYLLANNPKLRVHSEQTPATQEMPVEEIEVDVDEISPRLKKRNFL